MINSFETTVFHLLAHFLLWALMFIIFCGTLFLLVLVIVAAWNSIEDGYKYFNLTARNSPTSKVAGCKGFGLVQGLAPCA